jgi:hypothetical protein
MIVRRGLHRTDEIAIADAAMATLGVVVLLMVVFMAIAAKSRPRTSDCDTLAPGEIPAKVRELNAWMSEQKSLTDRLRRSLDPQCAGLPDPAGHGDPSTVSPLAGLCLTHQTAVVDAAGTGTAAIDALIAARSGAEARLLQCAAKLGAACKTPADREISALASARKKRHEVLLNEARTLESRIPEGCETPRIPVEPPLYRMADEGGLCPESVESVSQRAGVGTDAIAQALSRRDAAVERLAACETASNTRCKTLNAAERASLAARIRGRFSSVQDLVEKMKQDFRRVCPAIKPVAVEPVGTPVQNDFRGVCPADRDAVIEVSGVEDGASARLEAERSGYLAASYQCLAQQEQIVAARVLDAKYDDCKETPIETRPGAFFPEVARKIAEQLKEAPFNRIDVFGHADSRPVKDTCSAVTSAKDNMELSMRRGLQYRGALIKAFNDQPDHKGIADRLRTGDLRIYVIAVGDAEAHDSPVKPGGNDRKLEIRLVRDTGGVNPP